MYVSVHVMLCPLLEEYCFFLCGLHSTFSSCCKYCNLLMGSGIVCILHILFSFSSLSLFPLHFFPLCLLVSFSTAAVKRNSLGHNRLFVHHGHSSFQFLCSVYEDYDSASFAATFKPVSVNPKLTQGVSGTVEPDDAKENTPPGK